MQIHHTLAIDPIPGHLPQRLPLSLETALAAGPTAAAMPNQGGPEEKPGSIAQVPDILYLVEGGVCVEICMGRGVPSAYSE